MNRLNFIRIICLTGIVVLLILTAWVPCIAEEKTAALSGIVVDTEGKPIPGFTISLLPVVQVLKTDENGVFTFTNVPVGPVQIMIPP